MILKPFNLGLSVHGMAVTKAVTCVSWQLKHLILPQLSSAYTITKNKLYIFLICRPICSKRMPTVVNSAAGFQLIKSYLVKLSHQPCAYIKSHLSQFKRRTKLSTKCQKQSILLTTSTAEVQQIFSFTK
jgi:hypothetical protein